MVWRLCFAFFSGRANTVDMDHLLFCSNFCLKVIAHHLLSSFHPINSHFVIRKCTYFDFRLWVYSTTTNYYVVLHNYCWLFPWQPTLCNILTLFIHWWGGGGWGRLHEVQADTMYSFSRVTRLPPMLLDFFFFNPLKLMFMVNMYLELYTENESPLCGHVWDWGTYVQLIVI